MRSRPQMPASSRPGISRSMSRPVPITDMSANRLHGTVAADAGARHDRRQLGRQQRPVDGKARAVRRHPLPQRRHGRRRMAALRRLHHSQGVAERLLCPAAACSSRRRRAGRKLRRLLRARRYRQAARADGVRRQHRDLPGLRQQRATPRPGSCRSDAGRRCSRCRATTCTCRSIASLACRPTTPMPTAAAGASAPRSGQS